MPPRPAFSSALSLASYAFLSGWFFAPVLFEGRIPFFRDITYHYYPGYVFLEDALRHGVWPLWSPVGNAGAPLAAPIAAWYPIDLLLTRLFGARGALCLGPPLHVWLSMAGAFLLAKTLRLSQWGAWAAGAFYGSSGLVLSCVSLLHLLQAVAWAPWTVAAALRLQEDPTPRRVAVLACVLALLVSTLSGEIAAQTALMALLLLPRPPSVRSALAAAGAAILALALLAPVLLPLADSMRDTPRGRGLATGPALAEAASGGVLLEATLPRFFGDAHTMTDRGYWGQPFFPTGSPYFTSLYVGPLLILLALRARAWRLLAIALVGVLLALGPHGPLAAPLGLWAHLFRAPVKFLFLTTLALCLAAGAGLSAASARARDVLALTPAVLLLAGAWLARHDPSVLARAATALFPGIDAERSLDVIARLWPDAWITTGALTLAGGLALLGSPRLRPMALVLALCDVVIVNTTVNPSAPSSFFDLGAPTRALLGATAPGPWRLFAMSHEGQPLHWRPDVLARDRDVALYALDRQTLVPQTQAIDGIEGALDEDRTGFAPAGSTLAPANRGPDSLLAVLPQLRWANVRYVLSLSALPSGLVREVAQSRLPEVAEPLRLYEVPDALPRAFFLPEVGRGDAEHVVVDSNHLAAMNAGGARVRYRLVDPHRVDVEMTSGPGWLIVLDGYDPRWQVAGASGPVLRANDRYRAVATPGGSRTLTFRFVQPHLALAFGSALLAFAIVALFAIYGQARGPWGART